MIRSEQVTAIALLFAAILSCTYGYETLQGPTETRYWDESRAYNGYTLFGARRTSYLIDMEGRVVHTWPVGTNPRLLDNGNLLDASTDDPSHGDGFVELDWNGNTVWEYYESRDDYEPHHDFVRIFNTNLNAYTTLYIANKTVTHDQAIAAGCDPANGPYDGAQMDAIVEVNMSSNVVWECRTNLVPAMGTWSVIFTNTPQTPTTCAPKPACATSCLWRSFLTRGTSGAAWLPPGSPAGVAPTFADSGCHAPCFRPPERMR